MKKLFLISLGLLLSSLSLLTAEDGVEFSGSIESIWGICAPWTDKDTSAGKLKLGTTNFTGKIDAYYGKSSACVEAAFSYDAATSLTGGGEGSGNLGGGFDLSLGEAWIDYTDSFWGLRIGRQKAVWGKADGIDITNVICPSDLSSLAAMISDDSKLAVDAVRLSLNGNLFTADAWWIPFFTPADLPEGSFSSLNYPEAAIWNGEYALRLSGYLSALDLSLYAFYGWDDNPFIADTSKKGDYERMTMLGADAALPLGQTVLRLETAFFPQRYFQKSLYSGLGSQQHNQLSGLAGIDWISNGWTITAQYYCDYVFGNLDSLNRTQAYEHGASLSISKSLVNETLELSFSGLMGFNDFDSMLSPSVNYSISDQIKIGMCAYFFLPGPDRDGKYGAYKDYSSFCLNAKFSF